MTTLTVRVDAPPSPSVLTRLTGFASPARRRLVAAINVLAAALLLFGLHPRLGQFRIDLAVYRIGARAWLHGSPLYGSLPPAGGIRLPFTYPPIAAIAFSPLELVPFAVASLLITAITLVALAAVVRVVAARLREPDSAAGARLVSIALPAALLIEPIRSTVGFGQINVVLMALVMVDCLAPNPRWRRGVLVGLAAAIKLTPLVFILFFIVKRDRRSSVAALAGFVGFGLLGFVVAPADSIDYWGRDFFDAGRIGGVDYASNQSITGVLARLGVDGSQRTLWWAALSALVLVVAAKGIGRAHAAEDPVRALVVAALVGLLISPISWSHHWVWLAPTLLYLGVSKGSFGRPVRVGLLGFGLLVAVLAPQWWLPNTGDKELRWAPWEQVVGAPFVVFALVFLVAAAGASDRRATATRRPTSAGSSQ